MPGKKKIKKVKRYQKKIVTCALKTVEQRRGGTASLDKAVEMLGLIKEVKAPKELKALAKRCKKERKAAKKEKLTPTQMRTAWDQENSNVPADIKKIVDA